MSAPRGPRSAVFVLPWLELAGAERQALLLARHLAGERGWRVEIWGVEAEIGRVAELCDLSGIPWEARVFRRSRNRLRDVRNHVRFALRLRRARPTVVLPYTIVPNVVCGLTWRLSGARSCVWNQRDDALYLTRSRYHRAAVAATPRFVANSPHAAESLARLYELSLDRITVVPNAVELEQPREDRAAWREKLRAGPDDVVATMVAHVHRHKDHATLIRAWGRVAEQLRPSARRALLVLAGRVDSGRPELEDLAAQCGVAADVVFLGRVDDVAGLLGASDLGVFSSVKEGSPNGVLECMAAGLPVAATDIPGIRAAVGSEGWPWLAPVGDADRLTRSIVSLIREPGVRAALASHGRRRVADLFAPSVVLPAAAQVVEAAAL